MAVISPVSDLRNYNTVLKKAAVGSPVYQFATISFWPFGSYIVRS